MEPKKILIVTEAWQPQINGVVRSYEATVARLKEMGHHVKVVSVDPARRFLGIPLVFSLPGYREIKIELFGRSRIGKILDDPAWKPDLVHIATEGPLGWAARKACMKRRQPFTTSWHTQWPDYLAARAPLPFKSAARALTYSVLRRFHAPSATTMVATVSIEKELRTKRFHRIARWSRGVDLGLFYPRPESVAAYEGLARPIYLYVGRVSLEKNLPAFLAADVPGSKVVIGNGPDFAALKQEYPQAHFLGSMQGEELARHYAAADVFVFPSKSDTFGLVLLEAFASGLRMAALPAAGPADICAADLAATAAIAVLNPDIAHAMTGAAALPRNPDAATAFAGKFSWATCTEQFFQNLQAPTLEAKKRVSRFGKLAVFVPKRLRFRYFGKQLKQGLDQLKLDL